MWFLMKEVETIEAKAEKKMTFDEKGFFVIMVKEEKIIVEHYLNVQKEGNLEIETGNLNKIITGTSSKSICDTIIKEGLISRLDHAAYLGRELQKAEIALENNLEYEQCEPIQL